MLDTLEQVVADQVTGGGLKREASPQLRGLDVGAVPGLLHPRPRRVIRPAPAVFGVEGVTERVECLLPARRRDVEAPAGLQVAPRGEDMHVNAAVALAVHHGRPGVAVGLEPRPGRLFKGIQNRADLRVGRSVVRCPGNHARRVLVLERQRVGHHSHFISIHADGSNDPNASGYRVAAPRRDATGRASQIAALLDQSYGDVTGIKRLGTVTRRMQSYYAFNFRRYKHALHPMTIAVILEAGFLTSAKDRQVIVNNPDRAARGIVAGVAAFSETPPPVILADQ